MKELLRGIAVPGVKAFAEEYLRRPFAGRVEALQRLDRWHTEPPSPLLVCAEAGRGKSALVLRWALQQAKEGTLVAWVPISLRFGTARSTAVDEALYGRLQALLPQEGARHWRERLQSWPKERPLLLIIDGLDEALDTELEASLRALGALSSVRLLVAARRGTGREVPDWAARLGWKSLSSLELGPLERDELTSMLGEKLSTEELSKMYRVTGGDPLLVSFYLEQGGVEGGGLEALFDSWWREQERSWQQRGEDLSALTRALLRVFACAMGPLDVAMLSRPVGADSIEEALTPLSRFVVKTPEGYVLSHPRLNDFFRERLSSEERQEVEQQICALGKALYQRWQEEKVPLPAYLVRWLRMHLERVRDDEGLQSLVSLSWLDAHQRLDSSDVGFREDLRAARWRACLRVIEAEHEAARIQAVSDHAACLCIQEILDSQERDVDPLLRAAFVQHGLRAEYAAIRSLEVIPNRWDHEQAAKALIPVLSEEGFRSLLEGASPQRQWPIQEISQRLRLREDWEEAYAWLAGERTQKPHISAIVGELSYFPSPWRERLQEVLLSCQEEDKEDITSWVEERCLLASGLPIEKRRALLSDVDAALLAHPEEQLYWDDYERSKDPRLVLCEAWCQANEPARALIWLERAAAFPFPYGDEDKEKQLPSQHWSSALVSLVALTGNVPASVEASLQKMLTCPDYDARWHYRRFLLPLFSPTEQAKTEQELLEGVDSLRERVVPLFCLIQSKVSQETRQKAVALWLSHVLQLAREDQGSQKTYSTWYCLSQHVMGSLPDIEKYLPVESLSELFETLCAWAAKFFPGDVYGAGLHSPWAVSCLSSLLKRQPSLAARVYASWAKDSSILVWHAAAWTQVVPLEARRARLLVELGKRRIRLNPKHWFALLKPLASLSPKDTQPILSVMRSLVPKADAHALADLVSLLNEAQQGAFVEQLLALPVKSRDARNQSLGLLLPKLLAKPLRERLARMMCEAPPEHSFGSLPYWAHAALEALPEEERALAEERLTPKTLLKKAQEAPPKEKLYDYARWISWENKALLPEERRPQATALLQEVMPLLFAQDPEAENAFVALSHVLLVEDLMPWIEALETKASSNIKLQLLDFFLQREQLGYAERFVHAAGPLARLNLWLKTLSPQETLKELFSRDEEYSLEGSVPSYPWVLEGVRKLGRVWEHALLMREAALSTRLQVWRELWPLLSTTQQEALREDLFEACKEEQEHPTLSSTQRFLVLPMLSDEQVRLLWSLDGAPSGIQAFLGSYYLRFGSSALTAASERIASLLQDIPLRFEESQKEEPTDEEEPLEEEWSDEAE